MPLADDLRKIADEYLNQYLLAPDLAQDRQRADGRTQDAYAGRLAVELLQNARDAIRQGADLPANRSRILFKVTQTALLVANDGSPFLNEGIRSLCRFGASTKMADDIGQFGLGFRSVLEVTDQPQVASDRPDGRLLIQFDRALAANALVARYLENPARWAPSWQERIDQEADARSVFFDLITPFATPFEIAPAGLGSDQAETFGLLDDAGYATVIRLPFKPDVVAAEVFDTITDQISGEAILFMGEVAEVLIAGPCGRTYRHVIQQVSTDARCIHVRSSAPMAEVTKTYAVFKRSLPDVAHRKNGAERSLTLAIPIGLTVESRSGDPATQGPWATIPSGNLWTYYPTDVEFEYGFLLHADFELSDDRRQLSNTQAAVRINHDVLKGVGPAFRDDVLLWMKQRSAAVLESVLRTLAVARVETQGERPTAIVAASIRSALSDTPCLPAARRGCWLKPHDALVPKSADHSDALTRANAVAIEDKHDLFKLVSHPLSADAALRRLIRSWGAQDLDWRPVVRDINRGIAAEFTEKEAQTLLRVLADLAPSSSDQKAVLDQLKDDALLLPVRTEAGVRIVAAPALSGETLCVFETAKVEDPSVAIALERLPAIGFVDPSLWHGPPEQTSAHDLARSLGVKPAEPAAIFEQLALRVFDDEAAWDPLNDGARNSALSVTFKLLLAIKADKTEGRDLLRLPVRSGEWVVAGDCLLGELWEGDGGAALERALADHSDASFLVSPGDLAARTGLAQKDVETLIKRLPCNAKLPVDVDDIGDAPYHAVVLTHGPQNLKTNHRHCDRPDWAAYIDSISATADVQQWQASNCRHHERVLARSVTLRYSSTRGLAEDGTALFEAALHSGAALRQPSVAAAKWKCLRSNWQHRWTEDHVDVRSHLDWWIRERLKIRTRSGALALPSQIYYPRTKLLAELGPTEFEPIVDRLFPFFPEGIEQRIDKIRDVQKALQAFGVRLVQPNDEGLLLAAIRRLASLPEEFHSLLPDCFERLVAKLDELLRRSTSVVPLPTPPQVLAYGNDGLRFRPARDCVVRDLSGRLRLPPDVSAARIDPARTWAIKRLDLKLASQRFEIDAVGEAGADRVEAPPLAEAYFRRADVGAPIAYLFAEEMHEPADEIAKRLAAVRVFRVQGLKIRISDRMRAGKVLSESTADWLGEEHDSEDYLVVDSALAERAVDDDPESLNRAVAEFIADLWGSQALAGPVRRLIEAPGPAERLKILESIHHEVDHARLASARRTFAQASGGPIEREIPDAVRPIAAAPGIEPESTASASMSPGSPAPAPASTSVTLGDAMLVPGLANAALSRGKPSLVEGLALEPMTASREAAVFGGRDGGYRAPACVYSSLRDAVATLGTRRRRRKPHELPQDTSRGELSFRVERWVAEFERNRLREAGRDDLADRVEWVGEESARLPFDVASFELIDGGAVSLEIEVKSSSRIVSDDPTMNVSTNQLKADLANGALRRMYLVFNVLDSEERWELITTSRDELGRLRPTHYQFQPLRDARESDPPSRPRCDGCVLRMPGKDESGDDGA